MIKVFKNSIIYVVCPYGKISGGHETLHQLVSVLRDNGYRAYMHYLYDKGTKNDEVINIPDKFKKYNIKCSVDIVDNNENIIVIPEIFTGLIYKYKNIRKCIWFLSLDFYLSHLNKNHIDNKLKDMNIPLFLIPFFKPLAYLYLTMTHKNKKLDFKNKKEINDYFYVYNCQYIKDFLINNSIKDERTFYLCGPIGNEYIKTTKDDCIKEDILVYNPAKGYEFTKKIIEKLSETNKNLKIVPIKNMSSAEILDLLRKAKIYIDFGFFPGPERIPREAVCCYCNIVTSTSGSAKNKVDILVPKEFKINAVDSNIEIIVEKVNFLLNNYEANTYKFDKYREKVIQQKDLFKNNITKIFNRKF